MRRRRKWLVAAGVILAGLAAAGYGWHCYQYPYGRSHSCDKQLAGALLQYADRHGGWFPQGEATPEASLSLLYRDDPSWVSAELIRGKTVPAEVVQDRIARGELLSPEMCGWHYVEGLRADDDRRLALFWDKAGLGHNGERLSDGGHYVGLVGGDITYIPGAEWEAFLDEQQQLRAALNRPK
ncbi:MAG: hypothetical protein K2X82_04720 [Gemmataceae bacterium]|nr:hypothetical protein [Gemmataceae bacterium]